MVPRRVLSLAYLASFYLENPTLVAAVDADDDDDLGGGDTSEKGKAAAQATKDKKEPVSAEDEEEEDVKKEPEEPARPAHWQDSPILTEFWKLVGREGNGISDEAEAEKKNEEKLEAYAYGNGAGITQRSKDGRGFLWWAWEFQSKHALAVAKAYGANPFVGDEENTKTLPKAEQDEVADMKDAKGAYAYQMCKGKKPSSDIDDDLDNEDLASKDMTGFKKIADMPEPCHSLVGKDLKGLDTMVTEILERKKKREEAETAALDDDEEDDDDEDEDDKPSEKKAEKPKKAAKKAKKVDVSETDDDDDEDSADDGKKKKKLDVNVGLDDDDL